MKRGQTREWKTRHQTAGVENVTYSRQTNKLIRYCNEIDR